MEVGGGERRGGRGQRPRGPEAPCGRPLALLCVRVGGEAATIASELTWVRRGAAVAGLPGRRPSGSASPPPPVVISDEPAT